MAEIKAVDKVDHERRYLIFLDIWNNIPVKRTTGKIAWIRSQLNEIGQTVSENLVYRWKDGSRAASDERLEWLKGCLAKDRQFHTAFKYLVTNTCEGNDVNQKLIWLADKSDINIQLLTEWYDGKKFGSLTDLQTIGKKVGYC